MVAKTSGRVAIFFGLSANHTLDFGSKLLDNRVLREQSDRFAARIAGGAHHGDRDRPSGLRRIAMEPIHRGDGGRTETGAHGRTGRPIAVGRLEPFAGTLVDRHGRMTIHSPA